MKTLRERFIVCAVAVSLHWLAPGASADINLRFEAVTTGVPTSGTVQFSPAEAFTIDFGGGQNLIARVWSDTGAETIGRIDVINNGVGNRVVIGPVGGVGVSPNTFVPLSQAGGGNWNGMTINPSGNNSTQLFGRISGDLTLATVVSRLLRLDVGGIVNRSLTIRGQADFIKVGSVAGPGLGSIVVEGAHKLERLEVDNNLDGPVLAQNAGATLGDIVVTGDIGSPTNRVSIIADLRIDSVEANNAVADIFSLNGALVSDDGFGVLDSLTIHGDFAGEVRSPRLTSVQIDGDLNGTLVSDVMKPAWKWEVGHTFNGKIDVIRVGVDTRNRLEGQIVFNAGGTDGVWVAGKQVRVGQATPGVSPFDLVLTGPSYAELPAQLGMDTGPRSIGLAPFRQHMEASDPPDQGFFTDVLGVEETVRMRFYGPIKCATTPDCCPNPSDCKNSLTPPVSMERRLTLGNETPVDESLFSFQVDPTDANTLIVTGPFKGGFQYLITPVAELRSADVAFDPAVVANTQLVTVFTQGGGGGSCPDMTAVECCLLQEIPCDLCDLTPLEEDECNCIQEGGGECEGGGLFTMMGPSGKGLGGDGRNGTYVRGPDFNSDGVVDDFDLDLLMSVMGKSGPTLADLNFDFTVDGADLAILLAAYGPVGK